MFDDDETINYPWLEVAAENRLAIETREEEEDNE